MPDLSFRAGEASVAPAAVPTIVVPLHISNANPAEPIRSIGLNCQVRIQPLGRSYTAIEEARLLDLFGERERWARTMTPLLWITTSINVHPFAGRTVVDLSLPCSLDFDLAATKYFYGLAAGAMNVSVVFSGTVFYANPGGALQIAQIPWDREARFPLPIKVWQKAIAAHYGETAWLRLPKETFDRLYLFRTARGIAAWDQLLNQLLNQAERAELRNSAPVSAGAQP